MSHLLQISALFFLCVSKPSFGLGDENTLSGVININGKCDRDFEERKVEDGMVVLECNGSSFIPFKCNLIGFGARLSTTFDYHLLSYQIADPSSGNLTKAARRFAASCKNDDWFCACKSINKFLRESKSTDELHFIPKAFGVVKSNYVAPPTKTRRAGESEMDLRENLSSSGSKEARRRYIGELLQKSLKEQRILGSDRTAPEIATSEYENNNLEVQTIFIPSNASKEELVAAGALFQQLLLSLNHTKNTNTSTYHIYRSKIA